jgi:hypothetical protein
MSINVDGKSEAELLKILIQQVQIMILHLEQINNEMKFTEEDL